MAHPIGFEEQRAVEGAGRHRLEIIGAVEPGGAVPVGGADRLEPPEEAARRILGAVEHEMLEEVGEAGLAPGLVLGADMIPDRDRDDRRLVVLVDDDAQAVGQREGLVGDVHLPDELGERRRGRRSLRGGGHPGEGGEA